MGKVIAFSNQKGGSGKSTLAANIAVLWSNSGYKVAVIDADAQQSLTYWLTERNKYYGEDDCGIDSYKFDIRNLVDEVKTIKNLSRARTAWLRRGVDKCDDNFIKQMSEEEKTELSLKVQEYQNMGEEKPSP